MSVYAVVQRQRGPAWDVALPMEGQERWHDHAAFMNGLVDRGFVVLGGPMGDEGLVLLIVRSESEDEIRATLAQDPWSEDYLVIVSVEPWTIRLGELD